MLYTMLIFDLGFFTIADDVLRFGSVSGKGWGVREGRRAYGRAGMGWRLRERGWKL